MEYTVITRRFSSIIFINYLKQMVTSHNRLTETLLLTIVLNVMASLTFATEVEMGERVINLKSSIVKWMLAINDSPMLTEPGEPKLVLATTAKDTDDFAYLMELNRELRHNGAYEGIPVELAIQTTRSGQEKLYSAFSDTSDLKINWFFEDEGPKDEAWLQIQPASLTLCLSNCSGMKLPSTLNWLAIAQYSNVDDSDKDLYKSFTQYLSLSERYHQRSGVCSLFSSQTTNNNTDSRYGEEELNLPNCPITEKQNKCSAAISRFGLGKLHLGLPFNSELIEKVDHYETSEDKTSTALYKDLKQLLKDKPWLGLGLTGHALKGDSDLDTQAETILNTSYYTAYYQDKAFLKEYLDIIRRIEPGEIKVVIPLKWAGGFTVLKDMLVELGFTYVRYRSIMKSSIYCTHTASKDRNLKLGDCDPDAPDARKIMVIDPGLIDDDNAYNALVYFSQPLTLVKGDINLTKAIAMNKIPFYEWLYTQTQVNEHLQSFWQGTGLEAFFVNEYQPEIKAALLNQFNFDSVVRRQINKRIIKAKNAMPDLLDVIWLAHRPNHPLWGHHIPMKIKLAREKHNELFDEIKNTESPEMRDVLAVKVLIQAILEQCSAYDQEQLNAIFGLVQDPRLPEYLLALLNKR
ncbi:hypothetical protein [Endozoicomonas sp. 4G]|uniref:hypothetical protein n=1 Tax=Endozoicomonas sp. 4G TaxID=2872754 RepID=UPI00207850BF|nr:hypothetical protein [Endozoicomonas sp. 4G]